MARQKIAALDREAKAAASGAEAALLFYEAGRLWEDPLNNPRNAAIAYQNAHRLAPKFLSNIRAARRLFENVGNWQMVVQLLDSEIAATDHERHGAILLFQKAQMLEGRLGRRDEAMGVYLQCLSLQPRDVPLLMQLEDIYGAHGEQEALVEVYRLLAQVLEDSALRAHYLTSAGYLLEERLEKPDQAVECFFEAFAIERRDPLLLSAVIRVAERLGRYEELLAALAAQASFEGLDSAPTYLRISRVYDQLGRKEDALAALLAARRATPQDALILSELANIYEEQGRHPELAEALLSWVDAVHDENEVVGINLRLAALYEETLKRDEDAIARYTAILVRIPDHSSALTALGRLYYRKQDWAGLLSTFDAEAASIADLKQKAAKLYKAGEVLEERLGRPEEAIARYRQCMQLQTGYAPAQQALVRLYEQLGRYQDLVALHEQALTHVEDPDHVIGTLIKMAVLHEDRLSDPEHAIECLQRILRLDPKHLGTIRALQRLYQKTQRWREWVDMNDAEAPLLTDPRELVALYHRSAEILEDLLKDRPAAVATYRRLLTVSSTYLPALKALGRLYAEEARWSDLLEMYRAEAEMVQNPGHAASLNYQIGELYETRLKDPNSAISSYREALTLAPSYFPALRALERLYRSQKDWESLVEIWRAEGANRTDPLERANALFEAATLWEEKLQRPEMAVDCYREILQLTPDHPAANRALERYYTVQDSARDLVAVLDRQSQTARSTPLQLASMLKLARIYLDVLGDLPRAAQCCEAVLELDERNISALKLLERIFSNERSRGLEVNPRLVEKIRDSRPRTAFALSQPEMSQEVPRLEDLKQSFEADPSDSERALALERLLRETGNDGELLALYEKRMAAVDDSTEKLLLALRIAELERRKPGDSSKALRAYLAALALDPHLLPALQGARELSLSMGDHAGATKALETEAFAARDPRGKLDALIGAGCLASDKLNDPEMAASYFRQALAIDALEPTANAWLEQILRDLGNGPWLAELYENQGKAHSARKEMPAAADRFLEAARMWKDAVGDQEKAIGAAASALQAQPSHIPALEFQSNLMLESGRYQEAADCLATRLKQGGEQAALTVANLNLGRVYQDRLQDSSRAAIHFQAVLSAEPKDTDALERLSTIYLQSGNHTGAADCLRRLIELPIAPEGLAKHTVALAQIYDKGFTDRRRACELYLRAVELGAIDAPIVDRLLELDSSAQAVHQLISALERLAASPGTTERRALLRSRIGDLQAGRLQQPAAATLSYQQALESDPGSLSAHQNLAELFSQNAATFAKAIAEHRQILKIDPLRLESLRALVRLWTELTQIDPAFCASGVLYFLLTGSDSEMASYRQSTERLPTSWARSLDPRQVNALVHPSTSRGLLQVLRAIGDQLGDLFPSTLSSHGIHPRTDRLKAGPIRDLVLDVLKKWGVEEFEVYEATTGKIWLDTTQPFSICLGPEFTKHLHARDQRFELGRAAFGLLHGTPVVSRASPSELADLLGNSIRIHAPGDVRLGRKDEEMIRQLKKRFSKKASKALAQATESLNGEPLEVGAFVEALNFSADRAGLLACGDSARSLGMLASDPSRATSPPDAEDHSATRIANSRADIKELIKFAVSDDHFRLREELQLQIGRG